MYQVICVNDGIEHVLMDTSYDDYIIQNPILTLQLNGAGTLKFSIYQNHPEFDSIKMLTSRIKVYRFQNGVKKWMFTGRVMTSENDIKNTGKIECEGILAFLCDSIVKPYEFSGTPEDYIKYLVSNHNSQVDEKKQFKIGNLGVSDADSNNYITRANSNYPTSFGEIDDKVVELLDTYISATEEDGVLYISATQNVTHTNSQEINFGENIISLTKTATAEELRTVMIGIGKTDNDDNLTVEVENESAIELYGRIVGTVEFEDVTTLSQLESKTKAYLDSVLGMKKTIEVKAVDLNMTDSDIEEISLGYAYVTSEINGIYSEKMLISKMQLYLADPKKNTFTLGSSKTSISSTIVHSTAEINNRVIQIETASSVQIDDAVKKSAQTITGYKGGYVLLDCGYNANQTPSQILIMDNEDKEKAVNVIRLNKEGIGYSNSGYDCDYKTILNMDGNINDLSLSEAAINQLNTIIKESETLVTVSNQLKDLGQPGL